MSKKYKKYADVEYEDKSTRKIECKSNSNPNIVINNSFSGLCEIPEPLVSGTRLLGEDSGSFTDIGQEFTLIGEIPATAYNSDPILVSANINWRPEGVTGLNVRLDDLPIAEFKIVRETLANNVVLNTVDITAAQATAPAVLAPTVASLEAFDTTAPTNEALVYKLYAKVDQLTMNTMSPFSFMVRQYAVAAALG